MEKKFSPVAAFTGVAAVSGFLAADLWGRFTFNGDLPWGAMCATQVGLCLPVAVVVGLKSRTDKRWDGWLGVALMFVTSAVGALCGIVLGS